MKLFIGCSSSNDIDSIYFVKCKEYLDGLFKDNDLVFGASDTGLMGLSYDIAKKNGRQVIGVCPKIYQEDFKKMDCDIEIVTETVGERTNRAIQESDGIIFLPGGIGTLYEFFSSVESKRSHEHDKMILLYNVDGYFDSLFGVLDNIYKGRFTDLKVSQLYHVSDSLEDTLSYLGKNKLS